MKICMGHSSPTISVTNWQLPPNNYIALMVTHGNSRGWHVTKMSCQYSVHAAASEEYCKFPQFTHNIRHYAFAWLTGRHVTIKIRRTGPWNLMPIQLYHKDIINEDELQEILMDLLEIAWCMNSWTGYNLHDCGNLSSICKFQINTSTKVTCHNFDDLVRQCYWVWGNMWLVSLFRKFLSLYFDTLHNAKVTILTSTDPIVSHKV